jgi:hypothetical protein
MSTGSTLETAVIAAATSIVVAVGTQLVTWRREHTRWLRERELRSDERRVTALEAAQDAAAALRGRFSEFGEAVRSAAVTEVSARLHETQRALREALDTFELRCTRVDDADVLRAAWTWRDQARYHSISAEEVSTAEELRAWTTLNEAFGTALSAANGPRRRARGNPHSS